MFNRFFGQKPQEDPKQNQGASQEPVGGEPATEQRFGFLQRTRQLFNRMAAPVEQDEPITDNLWEDLEEQLIAADVGPSTSEGIIETLQHRAQQEQWQKSSQVRRGLQEELIKHLGKPVPLHFAKQSPLTIILVIGVNGTGKTTSIAKLANRLKKEGHRVTLAAADTFRAGAIDQIKLWGERIDVPVVAQNQGSDPAAVVYDSIQWAKTHDSDVLLIDTAGRIQTKYNLMEELKKINRVIQKLVPDGPHELLLVIDATTGQNALMQARQFTADVGLTGVIVTKLDSTAKGGFAFAVADDLDVPIKFIGTGEKVDDLAPFEPQRFVAALFSRD